MTDAELTVSVDAILAQEGTVFQPGNPAAGDPCDFAGVTPPEWGRLWGLGREATADEVRSRATVADARLVYRESYIIGPHFDAIADPRVRQFTIDFGVNSGVERSAWYLQKAVGVSPDMVVGPKTLAAVAATDPLTLLCRLVRARVNMLTRWVRAKPAARGAYTGVIDRAVSFLPG